MIGPGKAFDTDKYFVICSNVIGGCKGSTGPSSDRTRQTGKPYGLDFPFVTIGDIVNAQTACSTTWASSGCSPSPAARWAACRCWSGWSRTPTAS